MRISNNQMVYGYLSSLNRSQERMYKLQEQTTDGKLVHRPSDDPVRAYRSLRFNTNLAVNEQFTQNAKDALSWMQESDGSLLDLGSVFMRAKELVISAVSPKPTLAYDAIAKELDGLINQAVQIGNTQLGDRYIFAGQLDKIEGGPFERKTLEVTPGVFQEYVVYKGDPNKISMRMQPGATNPRQDSINVTGNELYGPMAAVGGSMAVKELSNLIRIKDELLKPNPDMSWLSNTAIKDIDSLHDRVLSEHAGLGTRMANYEMAINFLGNEAVNITEYISANDDINVPKALTDFKTNENIYRMALEVGARIMPPSLLDFLR